MMCPFSILRIEDERSEEKFQQTLTYRVIDSLAGLAWIIIPLPISFEFYGIQYNSWRIFLGALSLPTFAIAVITLTYPESPKFLVSQGKTDKALAILRQIYAVNTGRDESEFPVGGRGAFILTFQQRAIYKNNLPRF